MTAPDRGPVPYARAREVVTAQRCAFGDDARGYCSQPAVEHLWCEVPGRPDGAGTMACQLHLGAVNHPIRDRHPVDGPCGLPATTWRFSHPAAGPGWCELDGIDWLAAAAHSITAADPQLDPARLVHTGHTPTTRRRESE